MIGDNAGDHNPFRKLPYHVKNHPFRLNPLGLAVCGALSLLAGATQAQVFDVNSPAVRQAYVGAATQEKKDAALAGLRLLFNQVQQTAGANNSPIVNLPPLGLILSGNINDPFNVRDLSGTIPVIFTPTFTLLPTSTILAANDGDLGAPGATVTLNSSTLRTLASFNTARNFTIGADGATIDTNGFNFGISGNVTVYGTLTKDGQGTLALTGNNAWFGHAVVANGVLEGNTNSLQTYITNNATVRFNQTFHGVYEGVISSTNSGSGSPGNFEKTGQGDLTLTRIQSYGGTTSILSGTLALSESGSLGNTSALNISTGAMFDVSKSSINHHVGQLSGGGNIVLGFGTLVARSDNDSTFAGSISGFGGLTKNGAGTLTLTGKNTYIGTTNIAGGTLALAGQGRLDPVTSLSISQGSFDISRADGSRQVSNITGDGNIRLGANSLTVNGSDLYPNKTFAGTISGSGGLTKVGSGDLILTGQNTYTGVTTISKGNLTARTQSISDRVVNNASLTLIEGNNATYAGSISGTGELKINGGGTLTLTGIHNYAGTTTITGTLLALAGSSRLNPLAGVAIYAGTFDIANSSSDQEVGSISGAGTIRLGANSLTVGRNNENTSYASTISGTGGLTKSGTGSLTLTGANSYTGITTINQGTLITNTQSISERVINNATLTMTEEKGVTTPFISAYSGNISGTGRFIKEGDGLIWLRGRNSYTGGTTVNSGYLIGNTDSLQGNISVSKEAALAFYQVDNGTYAGNLSGSGTLLQYGSGVLTLTGNNTYTGGTAFSGTLHVDRDANLGSANGVLFLAGGTLQIGADMTTARAIVLGHDGGTIDTNGYKLSTDVVSRISGPGALTKIGAGTLSLNGTDDPFAVAVKAGRLEINNVLNTNHVAVAAGAELGGSGYIFGHVTNSGRIARGGGIGAINVEGHVTFEPGSVFLVKTDAAANSDRLLLTSPRAILHANAPATSNAPLPPRATLNGGTVDVRAEAGNYRRETRYNILTADGGVTGQFNGVTSNLAFLTPALAYDPNNVYLTLTRNDLDYTAVAQTANQGAVARSLTRMANGATGDAATVTAALDGLSAQQARAAFDAIGAAGRAALPQVGALNQRAVNQNLVARLAIADERGALAPASGIAGRSLQLAFDETTRNDAAPVYAQAVFPAGGQGLRASTDATRNGIWLRAYGGTGRIDGDANAPGADYHFGGTLVGYDRRVSDHLTLGVYAGYAQPRYSQDVAASSAKSKSAQVGAYGRYASGAWHIDGIAGYARNDTDTSRMVSVGGLNRNASGSFDGDAWTLHVETGYTFKPAGFELQPLAALSWVRQKQDAYSETGAGALNLALPEQSQESLRSSLGVRTLHPFQAGSTQWVFEARAAWSHEFKNQRNINARLAGDPAAGVFTVSGPDVPRDSAVAGVGVAAQASKNLRLYADVNGELNGRSRAYALSAGLRYQW